MSKSSEYMKTYRQGNIKLIGGGNDPEITDSIDDFYLPKRTRDKLEQIKQIKSYNDLKEYLAKQNIELDTSLNVLKNERSNDNLSAVAQTAQKIATGIETYKDVYGNNALSALKKIQLYDQNLDVTAAFHYNQIGENDPLAGTLRLSNWDVSGRVIYHELGHAYQAPHTRKGEDALSYSNRIMKNYNKKLDFSYTGNSDKVRSAETMAEALAFGFTQGQTECVDFIKYLKKRR